MAVSDIWLLIETAMDENGMSQAELARRIGVSRSRLSYWIKHNIFPQAEYAKKITDQFGLDLNQLLKTSPNESLVPVKTSEATRQLVNYIKDFSENEIRYIIDVAKAYKLLKTKNNEDT